MKNYNEKMVLNSHLVKKIEINRIQKNFVKSMSVRKLSYLGQFMLGSKRSGVEHWIVGVSFISFFLLAAPPLVLTIFQSWTRRLCIIVGVCWLIWPFYGLQNKNGQLLGLFSCHQGNVKKGVDFSKSTSHCGFFPFTTNISATWCCLLQDTY